MTHDTTCTTEGCTKAVNAKGLCRSHYMKLWRYGTPIPPVMHDRTCESCGVTFQSKSRLSRYCTNQCKHMTRRVPCTVCGELKHTDTAGRKRGHVTCQGCKPKPAHAHGTRGKYREEACRCDECRAWARESMRKYTAEVKQRDGLSPTQKIRPAKTRRHPGNCTLCGKHMKQTRLDKPKCQPCRRRSQRTVHISKANRRSIYERDGWTCGICLEPVDPTLNGNDQWGPTIDHITPRSRGGSDEPSNLRLAHRWCNSARGNAAYVTDSDLRAA